MLACLSPAAEFFHESLSTLHYASLCSRLKTYPCRNVDPNLVLIDNLRKLLQKAHNYIREKEGSLPPELLVVGDETLTEDEMAATLKGLELQPSGSSGGSLKKQGGAAAGEQRRGGDAYRACARGAARLLPGAYETGVNENYLRQKLRNRVADAYKDAPGAFSFRGPARFNVYDFEQMFSDPAKRDAELAGEREMLHMTGAQQSNPKGEAAGNLKGAQ
eukprot:g4949.t1